MPINVYHSSEKNYKNINYCVKIHQYKYKNIYQNFSLSTMTVRCVGDPPPVQRYILCVCVCVYMFVCNYILVFVGQNIVGVKGCASMCTHILHSTSQQFISSPNIATYLSSLFTELFE